jgi:hypothetical protein
MNFNSTTFVVSALQIGRSAKVYAHKGGLMAKRARPEAIASID